MTKLTSLVCDFRSFAERKIVDTIFFQLKQFVAITKTVLGYFQVHLLLVLYRWEWGGSPGSEETPCEDSDEQ